MALRIPARQCGDLKKMLAGYLLTIPRVSSIVADGDPSKRLVLLAPSIHGLEDLCGLPTYLRDAVLAEGATPVAHTIRLGYTSLSVDEHLWLAGWHEGAKDAAMKQGLAARALVDTDFVRVLLASHEHGVMLRHFERSGAGSHWGGKFARDFAFVVGNRLGEMMMELREQLVSKHSEGAVGG